MTVAPTLIAPDPDDARRWAEEELSRAIYQDAQPTPIDRIARTVGDVIAAILGGQPPAGLGPWLALGALIVVTALIVVAVLIWGRPRRLTRSRAARPLFGEDDVRSATLLRRDADAAAARGAWDEAVVLRVRALARGLAERTILDPEPGMTVHRFAIAAGAAFPGEADTLTVVARDFDDVRYLRRPATAETYARVRGLDERIVAGRAEVRA